MSVYSYVYRYQSTFPLDEYKFSHTTYSKHKVHIPLSIKLTLIKNNQLNVMFLGIQLDKSASELSRLLTIEELWLELNQ